jgi:ABC-type antimicrobial peptide transport system permease subunit
VNAGTGMRARADVRSRTASLVVVTLVIGLAGAVSMAAFSGARRADSAYARYREVTNQPEAFMFGGKRCPFGAGTIPTQALAFPEVESWLTGWTTITTVSSLGGERLMGVSRFENSVEALSLTHEGSPRPLMLEGRMPSGADEILVGWNQVPAPQPQVGETVELEFIKAGHEEAAVSGAPKPEDLVRGVQVEVVGRAIMPGEIDGLNGSIITDEAFLQRWKGEAAGCDMGVVQLGGGIADVPRFTSHVSGLGDVFSFDTSTEAAIAERSGSLQGVILRMFGGLVLLAGLLVLGQVLVRRTLLGAIDTPILRALGMTRGQLVRGAAIPGAVVALASVVIAVVGAVGLTVFLPLAEVRRFEAEPGIWLEPSVLIAGAVVMVAGVMLSVVLPAWRTARASSGVLGTVEYRTERRPSRIATAVARTGLPVTAVAGTRLALEPGHGRTATPVRSGIIGLALAVTAMVGAFGFAASMDRLLSNPGLWGVRFDVATGHPFIGDVFERDAVPILVDDPGLADVTAGNFQETLRIVGPQGDSQESIWATETSKGAAIELTMLEGRWPGEPAEIALGAVTARTLGAELGGTVNVELGDIQRQMEVVGIAVFPDFGFGPGLGQGAATTMGGLRIFYPDISQNLVFARYASGADPVEVNDRVNAQLREVSEDILLIGDATAEIGGSLSHTGRSRTLPLALALMFGAVAAGALVHVLVTSVRRRRRDLAILRTIGFRKRQVASTVAWQATTIAFIALAIGVPLGVMAGRLSWALFADRLGVVSDPATALAGVLLVFPATLVLANLVALGPALFARRTRPAQILRAE